MTLDTTRAIRPVTVDDAQAIRDIYAPYVLTTAVTFDETPPTTSSMRERILEVAAVYPWLVCEADGKVLGYAHAAQHRTREAYRWSVDATVYVRQGHGRQGIGRRLYEALLPQLGDLGYANAYAGITLPNAASVGLHEAMGFKLVGVYRKVGHKLGAWHDVGWWELGFAHATPPTEPRHSCIVANPRKPASVLEDAKAPKRALEDAGL